MPWHRNVEEIVSPVSLTTGPGDLEAWLLARIAEALEADPLALDPLRPPSVYGFEADAAKALTRELERRLGRELPEDVFGAHRSVRVAARSLCTDTGARTTTLPLTREGMRRLVLARAARCSRPPSTHPGEGSRELADRTRIAHGLHTHARWLPPCGETSMAGCT
jgi:hypothetical protein